MKLRLELLLATALAAGIIWILLEARAPRGVVEEGQTRTPGAVDPPATRERIDLLEPPAQQAVLPERREAAASEPEIEPAAPAPTSRGRLVDEATLEPIPEALVATSVRNDWTDANGWFDTGDPLDGLDDLLVVNVGDDTGSHEVPKSSWTRLRNAWQVQLAIGPTYRLRFHDLEVPSPEAWEARLQREGNGYDQWHRLRKGSPPYLRFDVPLPVLAEGERVWLEARSPDGLHEGRGVVSSLVGIHEVEIVCRPLAVLRGRVVDENGVPWRDVELEALQLADQSEESLRTSTGADGTYQFSAREPGTMQVVLRPAFDTTVRDLRIAVPRGITQAADIVLERRLTGTIQGRLRCRAKEGFIFRLELRALDGSGFEAVRDISFRDAREFLFEGLPPGSFELSASSSEGFVCTPSSLRVQTPAKGLDFLFENAVKRRPYNLTLVDAESGAALEPILAEVRVERARSGRTTRGGTLIALADGVGFEWRATSPGHELAHGSEADFHLEGQAFVATRALQRGFGVRLRLRDRSGGQEKFDVKTNTLVRWDTPAVAGAEILADGELVATSDATGVADVDLPAEPARIEVRLAGWRVLDSPSFREGKAKGFPTSDVWMVRE